MSDVDLNSARSLSWRYTLDDDGLETSTRSRRAPKGPQREAPEGQHEPWLRRCQGQRGYKLPRLLRPDIDHELNATMGIDEDVVERCATSSESGHDHLS